jgi:hypothetical protein
MLAAPHDTAKRPKNAAFFVKNRWFFKKKKKIYLFRAWRNPL